MDPEFGMKTAGIDLRAIDQLGIKRLTIDSRRVKRGNTFIATRDYAHPDYRSGTD